MQSQELALDGHSFCWNNSVIDIPMRTFSGKYYANLCQTLDHLGVKTRIRHFQYTFMEKGQEYFQFFSNFHRILPCVTNGIFANLFIFACYLWYTVAIFLFPPYITKLGDNKARTESLDEYARRIRLPDVFLDRYLLPLSRLWQHVATATFATFRPHISWVIGSEPWQLTTGRCAICEIYRSALLKVLDNNWDLKSFQLYLIMAKWLSHASTLCPKIPKQPRLEKPFLTTRYWL